MIGVADSCKNRHSADRLLLQLQLREVGGRWSSFGDEGFLGRRVFRDLGITMALWLWLALGCVSTGR